jgi:serine protease Do
MGAWAAAVLALQLGAEASQAAAGEGLITEDHTCSASAQLTAGLPDLSGLAAGALPAVVAVITTSPSSERSADASLRDLYDKLRDGPRKGVGSGFIIHRDGWILTNSHVVEDADKIEIELGERKVRLAAKLVGMDAESDLALLKVEAGRPLPYLPLGDSDELKPAQWVLVIGSPFGLDHSVSLGIVSHIGRDDISPVGRPGTYDFIQTDASINPGNSGGPMLDLRGRVVAIATAVNATGQGIGFAIPINMAKAVTDQLRSSGKVVRSWLGVTVKELPAGLDETAAGVEVTELAADGPASRAGLKIGDVITTVEGHAIRTPARLRWYVGTAGVGREVSVALKRKGEADRTVRVVLREAPTREQAKVEVHPAIGE